MATSGRTLTGLLVGDAPDAWAAAGLPVTGDHLTVGGVTIRFAGADGRRGILGWDLSPPVDHEVDGLAPAPATGQATTGEAPTGRGYAVAAVDHLVVHTPDIERTTTALGEIDLPPHRTVDAARGDDGVRYRFFLLGTCVLELIGGTEVTGDGPARFVGLAFTAPDLGAFVEVASEPRDAVQPGRRIVTVRTRELGISVPLAVLSPRRAR